MDVSQEIYDLAERYLGRVRRSGPENIMAVCPFHQESTPSFAMSLVNGVFFCHSCHAKGALRTFLRDMGLGAQAIKLRYEALIEAARQNSPKPPDPLRPGVFDMRPIDETFLGLLDYCPTDLVHAGFGEAVLRHFEVGYDRWHNRITFPLRDIANQLVGISGRAVGNDVRPRYKVYDKEYRVWGLPERLNWNKSHLLYNANTVYPSIIQHNPNAQFVAVVEGFKACMWVYQAGITNVVGILGSYLSWEQQWVLERIGVPVYLFLDNNNAGLIGTLKAGAALLRSLPVKVVEYPERLEHDSKAQPDSLSPEEVLEQVGSAAPYEPWLQKKYASATTG